ncbi:MAG: VWA domain-containing protein [Acidobacteriaceae bacterium]|jgi:VWFA-related protein
MSIGARLVLISVLSSAVLSAQQNIPPTGANSARINLDVVVTPKSGPPVANLEQQDFTVFDNKTLQHLTSFQARDGSHDPIHVIILIDAVNSTYQNIAWDRGEIGKFLRANGGHLSQPTALALFTDTGTQVQQGFLTDGNQLATALDQFAIGLRNVRRSSQWGASDRFQLSMNTLHQLVEHEGSLPGRKMVFWVSPGWPLLSGPGIHLDGKQQNQLFSNIVGLSTQLRQNRITLYSIDPLGANEGVLRTFYYQDFLKGVSKPGQVSVGDLGLQVLATQTGGLALTSSNDIVSQLQKCYADTEAYYELSFDPAPADHRDEYHNLIVQVAKPGLTARTRTGYYAQP